jgi:hypothetical protein
MGEKRERILKAVQNCIPSAAHIQANLANKRLSILKSSNSGRV